MNNQQCGGQSTATELFHIIEQFIIQHLKIYLPIGQKMINATVYIYIYIYILQSLKVIEHQPKDTQ
jgi:hypothetical protein